MNLLMNIITINIENKEKCKAKHAFEELYYILERYDKWEDVKSETNLEAKEALKQYLKKLKDIKNNEMIYETGNLLAHTSYIRNLIQIKIALEKGKYTRACNEILTLLVAEPILQGRIYYNLMSLLEAYLRV